MSLPKVENIICASDSDKFYRPNVPSNDEKYNVAVFGHTRQAQVSQELRKVGFYVYTVDGPRVTGEYYAAASSQRGPQLQNAKPTPICASS